MNHILDANCWAAYAQEMLERRTGFGVLSFRNAARDGNITFDDGEIIIQQYRQCRAGQEAILNVFLEEMATAGRLKLVVPISDPNFFKALKAWGLPKGEHIYFRVAATSAPSVLVSDDIDFFDPTKKTSSAKVRQRCKSSASGPVCKQMRKHYGTEVVWLETFGV